MPASVRTASQRGRSARTAGLVAERDLVSWLRVNGWPDAERSVRTGYKTASRTSRDNGDVAGTPGILWSVKNCARETVNAWWAELMDMELAQARYEPTVRLLVVKNRGHACPADWWCWQPLEQLTRITSDGESDVLGYSGALDLVRCHLATMVTRLRIAGYGKPLVEVTW